MGRMLDIHRQFGAARTPDDKTPQRLTHEPRRATVRRELLRGDTRPRLVGGLAVASDADIVALDTVATGPSAGKIDLADALALAVRGL